MKGQAILGGVAFVEGLIDHLRRHKDIPEIPKSQRFVSRPGLEEIFKEGVRRNSPRRDGKVVEAVEGYGYTQREVADFLGLHFTSVSRIMKQRNKMQKK